jgi:hypothetical protein
MIGLLRLLVYLISGAIALGGIYVIHTASELIYAHYSTTGDYEFVGYLNTGNFPTPQGNCPSGQPQSVGTEGQCTAIQPTSQTNNLTAAECHTLKLWCTANAGGNATACDCSQHSDRHNTQYMGILRGYGYQVINGLTYSQCLALAANTFGSFFCAGS